MIRNRHLVLLRALWCLQTLFAVSAWAALTADSNGQLSLQSDMDTHANGRDRDDVPSAFGRARAALSRRLLWTSDATCNPANSGQTLSVTLVTCCPADFPGNPDLGALADPTGDRPNLIIQWTAPNGTMGTAEVQMPPQDGTFHPAAAANDTASYIRVIVPECAQLTITATISGDPLTDWRTGMIWNQLDLSAPVWSGVAVSSPLQPGRVLLPTCDPAWYNGCQGDVTGCWLPSTYCKNPAGSWARAYPQPTFTQAEFVLSPPPPRVPPPPGTAAAAGEPAAAPQEPPSARATSSPSSSSTGAIAGGVAGGVAALLLAVAALAWCCWRRRAAAAAAAAAAAKPVPYEDLRAALPMDDGDGDKKAAVGQQTLLSQQSVRSGQGTRPLFLPDGGHENINPYFLVAVNARVGSTDKNVKTMPAKQVPRFLELLAPRHLVASGAVSDTSGSLPALSSAVTSASTQGSSGSSTIAAGSAMARALSRHRTVGGPNLRDLRRRDMGSLLTTCSALGGGSAHMTLSAGCDSDWTSTELGEQIRLMAAKQICLDGKYTLSDEVAEGGQGCVVFGTMAVGQAGKRARVAIKFHFNSEAFLNEKMLVANKELAPHLPEVIEVSSAAHAVRAPNGRVMPPYIVLPRGEPLDMFIATHRPDSLHCIMILIHLAEKLAAMHASGLVHRDVKPANSIWLPSKHEWNLIDFGCAAKAGCESKLMLTPGYASPELVTALTTNEQTVVVDPAVDVWALGVVAYQLLAGLEILNLMTVGELWAALQGDGQMPWEREERAGDMRASPQFVNVVRQMLSRAPECRPTMQQVLEGWRLATGITEM